MGVSKVDLPPIGVTLSGNLAQNGAARCNLHDVPFPCRRCQAAAREEALRRGKLKP